MILDQVVQRIRDEWGQSQLSPELLRRIDGILDVNSVEHRVRSCAVVTENELQ